MKMKGRKATVFILNNIIFSAFFILSIFFAKDNLDIVGTAIVGAILLTGVTFIGGVVFEKWTQSKYFKGSNSSE